MPHRDLPSPGNHVRDAVALAPPGHGTPGMIGARPTLEWRPGRGSGLSPLAAGDVVLGHGGISAVLLRKYPWWRPWLVRGPPAGPFSPIAVRPPAGRWLNSVDQRGPIGAEPRRLEFGRVRSASACEGEVCGSSPAPREGYAVERRQVIHGLMRHGSDQGGNLRGRERTGGGSQTGADGRTRIARNSWMSGFLTGPERIAPDRGEVAIRDANLDNAVKNSTSHIRMSSRLTHFQ